MSSRLASLAATLCVLAAARAGAQSYQVLHAFERPAYWPAGGLVADSSGNLYGTTHHGGTGGYGTVFRLDGSGILTILHNFSLSDGADATAPLILDASGNLFGTTRTGGSSNAGTVFKLDSSGDLTTLHNFNFTDGYGPETALVLDPSGNLYGTTSAGGSASAWYGTVFQLDAAGNLTTLHSFNFSDGDSPSSLIRDTSGNLYGTTSFGGSGGYGTVFKLDTAGNLTTLHGFDYYSDGARPSSLVLDTSGILFGATTSGGSGGYYGTIFKTDVDGASFTTLHTFTADAAGASPNAGLMLATDGILYGTTSGTGLPPPLPPLPGTIFRIDTNGSTFATLYTFTGASDGSAASGGVVQATDGKLHGTTAFGGADENGTIFTIDTDGSSFTTAYAFPSGTDGAIPTAGLIQAADGNLYGTTWSGGPHHDGTIFRSDTKGSAFTILYSFVGGSDSVSPSAGLIQAADGNLYGTTSGGGPSGPGHPANDYGTIFRIDPNDSTLTTLHTFFGSDGAWPMAGLLQATDGNLYGTTPYGGAYGGVGYGTIFRIDTNGSTLTTLHSFNDVDGANPHGSLIQVADGNLYGTTSYGGADGMGTIFRIDLSGSTFVTLRSFTGIDGQAPFAGVTQATDGRLYGTTTGGGGGGYGTIFGIDTSGSTLTTLHSFIGSDGWEPQGGVIQGLDGSLYGTAEGGPGEAYGTIFRIDTAGSTFTTLHGFTADDGAYPSSGLMQAIDGSFYGTSPFGGLGGAPGGAGVVFRYVPGCFGDLVPGGLYNTYICTLAGAGITAGCGNGNYCSDAPVTRVQMAVLLLKSEHGSTYIPPSCTGIFPDVSCPGQFTDWVEQLAAEGVTVGCGEGFYCPDQSATRRQMAVFLLKAKEGSGYAPPPATGIFVDVPSTDAFAPWIEELYSRQVTGGCQASPLLYCPNSPSTRGQMAVFLVKTFGL